MVWLRAAAFRAAGANHLAGDGDAEDPRGESVKLLKAVNAVVSAPSGCSVRARAYDFLTNVPRPS